MPVDEERTCAGLVLVWIDLFLLLLGLALLGYSSYVLIQGRVSGSVSFVATTSYMGLGVGGGLVIASILGCIISRRGASTILRLLYLVLVVGALAVVVAGAVLVSQAVDTLRTQGTVDSSTLTGAFAKTLNNVLLSTYTACCTGCGALSFCDASQVAPFYASNNQNCYPSGSGIPTCASALRCNALIKSGCYVDESSSAQVLIPAYTVDQGTCDALTSLGLVGARSASTCGNGSPAAYLTQVGDALAKSFNYVTIGFSVFAGLLGLAVFCTLVVLCCERRRK